MKTQKQAERLINRYDLAALSFNSVPGTNHQLVDVSLANYCSGRRGGRYKNVRHITLRESDLVVLYASKVLRLHANFRRSA
jgi:hypothetical protein